MEELIIPEPPEEIHPLRHMFVSNEIAKKLYEFGFNEPCFAYFRRSYTIEDKYVFHIVGEYHNYNDYYQNYVGVGLSNREMDRNPVGKKSTCFTAPLYQQVVDWFRVKYSILIHVSDALGGGYYSTISKGKNGTNDNFIKGEIYDNYYPAFENAIIEALKLIKS